MYSPRNSYGVSRFNNSYMYLDNSNQSNSDVFLVTELCPSTSEELNKGRREYTTRFNNQYRNDLPTSQPIISYPTYPPTPSVFPSVPPSVSVCPLNKDGTSSCGSGSDSGTDRVNPNILDPRLNLREATKNMLLLEDHLLQDGMNCEDCICKHMLLIDAYLSEALSLDTSGQYTQQILDTLKSIRSLIAELKNNPNPDRTVRTKIAQQVRAIRKPLSQEYACFV